MDGESIRKAVLSDMQLLFEWTNDELVRENSFCSGKININVHRKWFEKKLQSNKGEIFIYEINSIPVGQLRLDYEKNYDNNYEEDDVIIGYTIQRDQRGRGYGSRLLELAEDMVRERFQQRQDISNVTLIGRVKYSNEVSSRCFIKLGYQGEELDHYIEYRKNISVQQTEIVQEDKIVQENKIMHADNIIKDNKIIQGENIIQDNKIIQNNSPIHKYIPYGHQSIDEDDIQSVVDTFVQTILQLICM